MVLPVKKGTHYQGTLVENFLKIFFNVTYIDQLDIPLAPEISATVCHKNDKYPPPPLPPTPSRYILFE